ncbi:hypothetical protein JB92DRAFT_2899812 [Gautieria morchelliformis]|nr:hypothetical protein JB92DRAFT_2899812 [Gautieria morchelliformis]
MTSPLPQEIMSMIETVGGSQIIRYGELAVLAFSLYDFVLCLSNEIDLVWRRPFRYMTVLYFITRHLMIGSLIIDAAYNPAQPHCSPMERFADVLKNLSCFCTLVLLVVCSWAMFDRSRLLLSICGFSAFTIGALDCVAIVVNDCAQGAYQSKASLLWSTINFCSQFVFDSIVMFLVIYNAFCAVSFERSIKALQRRTLANLILYDGLTYYITIFLVTLVHLLLTFLAPDGFRQCARPFIRPLSSVITARFLLNMRYMEVYPNSTTMMALTTMAVTIEWQPQPTKSEDCKDSMDDTYQHAVSVETGSIASNDTDVVLHPARRAVLNYDAAREISGILEKTFCA